MSRFITSALCALILLIFPAFSAVAVGEAEKEIVVLYHGITSGDFHMSSMASMFEDNGYEVMNIDYPSTKYSLKDLVSMQVALLKSRLGDRENKVSFVGHSMGGLLIRGILKEWRPKNLGRVLMVGTPNHGSEMADFFKDWKIFKMIFGPSGPYLTTNNPETEALVGKPDYPFGVIATVASIDYTVIGSIIISGDDDGLVALDSTKLDGMDAFIQLDGSHFLQPLNDDVKQCALNYIRSGSLK